MPFDNHDPIPEGHRRLLVLAEFLVTEVPVRQFSLKEWRCGTAACACGWAGTIPEFVALGFRIEEAPIYPGSQHTIPAPVYGAESGWPAVDTFFDLYASDAAHLFSELQYESDPTPHEVAARIRSFVAEHSPARVA